MKHRAHWNDRGSWKRHKPNNHAKNAGSSIRSALRPGDWSCPSCNCDRNFAIRTSCHKCGYRPLDISKLRYRPSPERRTERASTNGTAVTKDADTIEPEDCGTIGMDWIIEETIIGASIDEPRIKHADEPKPSKKMNTQLVMEGQAAKEPHTLKSYRNTGCYSAGIFYYIEYVLMEGKNGAVEPMSEPELREKGEQVPPLLEAETEPPSLQQGSKYIISATKLDGEEAKDHAPSSSCSVEETNVEMTGRRHSSADDRSDKKLPPSSAVQPECSQLSGSPESSSQNSSGSSHDGHTEHASSDSEAEVAPLDVATLDEGSVPGIMLCSYMLANHKRKCRNFYISPGPDSQIVTSALDGTFKFWQLSCSCHPPKLRSQVSLEEDQWPEDFAWHPSGRSVIAVFDRVPNIAEDEQVAVIDACPSEEKPAVKWLKGRPHKKGSVGCVEFMPWSTTPFFATGGTDHTVASWRQVKDDKWEPNLLHLEHTCSVYAITGPRNMHWVVSGAVDRRIIVYDPEGGKCIHKNKYDDSIVGISFNPVDRNLLLSHSCEPSRQFSLYDVRQCMRTRLHMFGWDWDKRVVSGQVFESWSPCGFYVASGSHSAKFPIFDIRFNHRRPVLTVDAGDSRVLKAAWHPKTRNILMSLNSTGCMSFYKFDPGAVSSATETEATTAGAVSSTTSSESESC